MTTDATDTNSARRIIIGLSVFVCAAVAAVIALPPLLEGSPTDGRHPSGLATLNAGLNACVAVALTVGWVAIKRGAREFHRRCMLLAFGLSSLFLVTYLLHHARVGSVPFQGEGWVRTIYYAILVPHIVLAAVIVPLALFTIYRGWTGRFALHRKIAKWTLPLWLYVAVSGVAIYLMLY